MKKGVLKKIAILAAPIIWRKIRGRRHRWHERHHWRGGHFWHRRPHRRGHRATGVPASGCRPV
ncbi:MAG: hypothetical protein AVDCRST_MAG22-183 [uncultured Rubrobacteraceae bacterium]|uniref:Uncharacterized protein n=1 Tax=uncultured Rubrobacteraceae bacterium TaxID=349277 RepID=A0A6J4NDA0_9ACTN|nr:MAG: hypothetical protein AVDCRST_MAG22-183 [uncultured Rubrobacteraceae bacterium]